MEPDNTYRFDVESQEVVCYQTGGDQACILPKSIRGTGVVRLDPPSGYLSAMMTFTPWRCPSMELFASPERRSFTDYDLSLPDRRLQNLVRQVLPAGGFERAQAKAWCGLRPMSVDGVPIIGPAPVGNLWLDTGHGRLGWIMAAGSRELPSDLLTADSPGVNPDAYTLARFNGVG